MKSYITRISERVVKECLQIREGESVLIVAGKHNLELAEEIGFQCYSVGATPLIIVSSDKYAKKVMKEIPVKHLERTHKHLLGLFNDLDVRIIIEPHDDPLLFKNVPEEKIGARRKANKPLWDKIVERGIKWCYLGWPSKKMARAYNIPYEELEELYLKTLNVDYRELSKRAHKLRDKLQGKQKIRVTHENGTDLTFNITNRRINVDDGYLDEENIKAGDTGLNLPSGEVFIAPLEDSANGVITFNTPTYYNGKVIKNLTLEFENGRVVKSSAEKGHKVFLNALRHAHGDKEFIGEFGIGLNPYARPIGYTLIDEKTPRSIHIALGENRGYGGKNNASIHWDIVLTRPTVKADGEYIMREGKLIKL